MAENSIDLVRKAEAEAEDALRQAQQKALELVDNANTEAVKLANDAEDAARDRGAGQVAAAHQGSAKALEEAMASLDGEMAALAENARARQPQAVDKILEALV